MYPVGTPYPSITFLIVKAIHMKATFNVLNYSSGSFEDGRKWGKIMCHDDEIQTSDMFNGLHVHTFPIPSDSVAQLDTLFKGKCPVQAELSLGMTVRQKQTVPQVLGARLAGSNVTAAPVQKAKALD